MLAKYSRSLVYTLCRAEVKIKMTDEKKKDPSAITAGLIGAAVGAAVAAGSIALADGKNRKKVEKLVEEIKQRGAKIIDLVQREAGVVKKLASEVRQGESVSKKKVGKSKAKKKAS